MRVHHLAFRTDDLARLVRLFGGGVGLALIRPEARRIWRDGGGGIVMLAVRVDGEPAYAAGSKELVAFTIAPDARALYTERLARAGVAIEASTEFTLYVRDPDGRRIGLSSYPVPLA
jgi:catechol 2,3-dioxygenase-like lactoylglutathione lyase family enzyme